MASFLFKRLPTYKVIAVKKKIKKRKKKERSRASPSSKNKNVIRAGHPTQRKDFNIPV